MGPPSPSSSAKGICRPTAIFHSTLSDGLLFELSTWPWLERLSQPTTAALVAIEGTPGKGGVTFLYAAMVELAVAKTDELIWLKPDIAASGLHGYDKRLLIRCS